MVHWYIYVIFILFFFVMDTHLSTSPFWVPPVKQAVSSSGTVANTISEVSLHTPSCGRKAITGNLQINAESENEINIK